MNGIINQYENMLQKKRVQKLAVLLVSVTIIWQTHYMINNKNQPQVYSTSMISSLSLLHCTCTLVKKQLYVPFVSLFAKRVTNLIVIHCFFFGYTVIVMRVSPSKMFPAHTSLGMRVSLHTYHQGCVFPISDTCFPHTYFITDAYFLDCSATLIADLAVVNVPI